MKASEITAEAGRCLVQRGVDYDSPGGERSMAHAIQIFNSVTEIQLTERAGWIMMMAVKMARMVQSPEKVDNYVDLCAYVALLGEEATTNDTQPRATEPDGPTDRVAQPSEEGDSAGVEDHSDQQPPL